MSCFCCGEGEEDNFEKKPFLKNNNIKFKITKDMEEVILNDIDGNEIKFFDIFNKKLTIISFLRHFGCVLCMEKLNFFIKFFLVQMK
jgi:hypothetical protein